MDGNGTAGGVLVSDGLIEVKTGTGNVAKIQFYCETGNAHAQTLQAAPHSAGSSAVLTLPTATGTLIATGDTGTVTNTMLAGSIVNAKLAKSTITIQDDSSTQDAVALGETLIFEGGSGVTTTVTDNKVSIATDGSIVTESSTDTLTNKTLTTPVIASLKPNGSTTLTMPAATDTLVGKATTDTLTNKTLTSPKVNENVAVTATATQLNHSVGVTSAIQTQLDTKAAKSFAIAQAVALG
tara:strand:- start:186 stop:902 length:717 start_codon:yes stop_codon:yes gene_type:complete